MVKRHDANKDLSASVSGQLMDREDWGSKMAERKGFEPLCQVSLTIRFRVGAVMTASVPLRWADYNRPPYAKHT